MGNLAFQELLLVLISLIFFLAIPVFFYWLGKRSGYKQGQLDMYQKRDKEGKS